MPLNIPNLDDRNYNDLVEEALSMLPRYAPEWTNYNPSDPGITLIELLAYFTELLIYRLNRVTKDTKIRFLQLLYGAEPDAKALFAQASSAEVDEALRQAVLRLRQPQRAVTGQEYEYLAREATAQNPDIEKVLRARSFVRRNLQTAD
ncbi:MAG: baseplate J/gp47 family protein, partial [Candidatus Binatia bacterium]